jgi:hypothetical protein
MIVIGLKWTEKESMIFCACKSSFVNQSFLSMKIDVWCVRLEISNLLCKIQISNDLISTTMVGYDGDRDYEQKSLIRRIVSKIVQCSKIRSVRGS